MMRAYILVVCKPGTEEKIVEELKKRKEVKDAVEVYGEYDIIVEVIVSSTTDLRKFVLDYLRKLPGIERTTTLVAAE